MKSLSEIQNQFGSDLLTTKAKGPYLSWKTISSQVLFNVYRNNFYFSYSQILTRVYPKTKHLVGEGFFNYLCHHFIRKVPYKNGDIRNFGCNFAVFIKEFGECQDVPFLADVARLEWKLSMAYRIGWKPNSATASLISVSEGDFAHLRVKSAPSCFLIHSAYPLFSIWELDDPTQTPEVLAKQGGQSVLVFAKHGQAYAQQWREADCVAWSCIEQGMTLSEAVGKAFLVEERFSLDRFLANCLECDTVDYFYL